MQCLNCGKDVVSRGTKPMKYCSDACRKAYVRGANGQKQTDKVANGQVSVEQTDTPVRTYKDACGVEHQVDFAARRQTRQLLRDWESGKETSVQKMLGKIASLYDRTQQVDMVSYLGLTG